MSKPNNSFKLAASCQNKVMASYQAKIRLQNQYLKLIKATLISPVAEHLLYCVISDKKCLLYTDAEEWATQLRFYQSAILDTISKSSFPNVSAVQVRLIAQPEQQQVSHKINLPSQTNIELLRNQSAAAENDELKQALLRLSKTLDSQRQKR